MDKVLGIVNFEGDKFSIRGMDEFRTIPAMSFMGKYRLIDFVLSNMVNSDIDQIRVLVKDKPRSLIEHIGSGIAYNLNTKHSSLDILFTDKPITNSLYYTDIALIKQYLVSIQESDCKYVVIAPSYMVCTIDYQDVVQQHIDSKADITCVYRSINDANEHCKGCTELSLNDSQRIISSKKSHGSVADKHISMETYVMSVDMLVNVIEKASSLSSMYTLSEYFQFAVDQYIFKGYEYKGYFLCINSLEEYFQAHMELLKRENFKEIFKDDWPIFTKTNDSPPAFYTRSAQVSNSVVTNGCVIHGNVENSIIGRGAIIEKGAIIKNSIILPKAYVGPQAHLEYCVVDKHAKVVNVKNIIGNKDEIVYIARRENI